jgi:hypothetical protein
MLYKAFAAITLLAAPIIVLVVEGAAPHSPGQAAAVPAPAMPGAIQSAPMAQSAPMPAPMSAPAEPIPDPAAFGQPMPDAGKPFLSPGNGLPSAPVPLAPPAEEGAADSSAPGAPS